MTMFTRLSTPAGIQFLLMTILLPIHCAFGTTDGQIPNQSYPAEEQWTVISPKMSDRHMNQPSVFNGYAILAGNAVHEVWDISDPYRPVFKAEMQSTHRHGEAESHQVTYGRDYDGNYYLATVSGRGVDIWDVTDTVNPRLAAEIELRDINYGDVAGAVWGLSWQGNYIYAGATTNGLYIIDVSELGQKWAYYPVEQMWSFQMGRVNAGPVFALGDLLVATTPKNSAGIATINISDPDNPVLMDSESYYFPRSYIGGFYGTHAFLINPLRIYDVTTDPYNITQVSSVETPTSEYVSFADDHLFLGGVRGGTEGIYKYAIRDLNNPTEIGRVPGRDTRWDDQFSCPVGNLLLMADDQFVDNEYVGAVIAVHDTAPDLTPPSVKAFYPANRSTSLSTSGQVAVSFSEWIEFKSVNPSTFILRPVNGAPLKGTWGCTYTTLTFAPDTPLEPATEYEIILPAGGITDLVGNPLAVTYTSTFTTPSNLSSVPIDVALADTPPVELGQPSTFNVISPNSDHTYTWEFGDGRTATGAAVTHVYSQPGRYTVTLRADIQSTRLVTKSFLHVVHHPATNIQPTSSQPIVLADGRVWAINPDANTVSAIDTTSLEKLYEIPVDAEPKSIAHSPDGQLWVTCRQAAAINIIDPDHGTVVRTLTLPYASQPGGIAFAPDGHAAFVCLQALGRLLKLSPTTGEVLATIDLGPEKDGRIPDVRELAINSTSEKAYVARFISPDHAGMVYVVNTATMTLADTILLAKSEGVDDTLFARGLPNYLNSITISPDGKRAWIAAKKDNIDRGAQLDGHPLGHDNVVRAITPVLDLTHNTDLIDQRIDYDNRDRCSSCTFSNRGDLVFVTLPGNHEVQVVDAYSGSEINTLLTQDVPIGTVLEAASGKLFVLNFLGRSLSVFDVSPMLNGESNAHFIRDVPLVASEPLPANVLRGKKFFYDAGSKALNIDGYMSCASCHIDGSHDGRTYDFTAPMGEGLRNTIDLRGRAGLEHGRLHWTGNFDEVHDFENQIRLLGQGTGLMDDADFNAGKRAEPFGNPKRNISDRLDDLVAYVDSLTDVPSSPYRAANGSLTSSGQAGKRHFNRLGCYSCHGGEAFTDSKVRLGSLHDVGTLTSQSGQRMGQTLTGIDTPTLRGIWDTAPYLHDGSAATLREVLTTKNPNDQHGAVSTLTSNELDELIAYLKQIDNNEPAALPIPTVPTGDVALLETGFATESIHTYGGQAYTNQPGPQGVRQNTLRLQDNGLSFGMIYVTQFAGEIDVNDYQDQMLEFWYYSDSNDPQGTIEIQLSFTPLNGDNNDNLWKWRAPVSLQQSSNRWTKARVVLNERNFIRNSPNPDGNNIFNLKRLNRVDVLILREDGSDPINVYVDGITLKQLPQQPLVLENYETRIADIEHENTYGGGLVLKKNVGPSGKEHTLCLRDDGMNFGLIQVSSFVNEIDISDYQDKMLEFWYYSDGEVPQGTIEIQLSFTPLNGDNNDNLWKWRAPASLAKGSKKWTKASIQLNERNFIRNSPNENSNNVFDLTRLNRIDVLMLNSNAITVYVDDITLKPFPKVIQPTDSRFVLEDYNGGSTAIDYNQTFGGGEAYRRVEGPLGSKSETLLLQNYALNEDNRSFGLIHITDFAYEIDIDNYRDGYLQFAYTTENYDPCRTIEIQLSFTNSVNPNVENFWKWRIPANLIEGFNEWHTASIQLNEQNFIRNSSYQEGNDFDLTRLNRIAVLVLLNEYGENNDCNYNDIYVDDIKIFQKGASN